MPDELPAWVAVVGGATIDELTELALTSDGKLYALGRFFDSLTEPVALPGFENYDLLLAAFEVDRGGARWLLPIGGPQSDAPGGLGLSGDRPHLAGRFAAPIRIGEAELRKGAAAQPFTAFHAVLDDTGATAALRGAAVHHGDGLTATTAVDGAAVTGEWSDGTLDFTAGSPGDALATDAPAVWLAITDEAGWGTTAVLTPDPGGEVRSAAVLATPSTVTVAGRYSGAVRFAGAPLLPASLQSDGYLVTFSTAPFAVQAFTTVRGAGPDSLVALARAGDELVAAGNVTGPVTLAGSPLPAIGGQDALVFGSTGRFRPWRAGAAGAETAVRALAAIGPAGATGVSDLIVAGTYTRPLTLGAIALPHRGGRDLFVARLRPDGGVAWARGFGGPADDSVADVAVAGDGRVFVGGTFSGTIELGGATRTAVGDSDWFVLALRP